ncbi:hypothetical protein SALBM311S_04014 [Streptomyces alboniger]
MSSPPTWSTCSTCCGHRPRSWPIPRRPPRSPRTSRSGRRPWCGSTSTRTWNREFYVKTQNLTLDQAEAITELANKPLFSPSWDEAIELRKETADLLAEGGFVKKFDVGSLFDHRFEGIAAKSVPAEYRR